MQMSPLTLVINLAKNTERMEAIYRDFRDWPIERVDAIKRDNGAEGCALSHIKCIKMAKERNEPWVLIIEDDCLLISGARERFIELMNPLWERRSEWDVFSGGVICLTKYTVVDRTHRLFDVKGYNTQFILIHSASYDSILDLFSKQPNIPVYDVFLFDHFRVWTSLPFLSSQRPDWSDILNRSVDYTEHFAYAERELMGYENAEAAQEASAAQKAETT